MNERDRLLGQLRIKLLDKFAEKVVAERTKEKHVGGKFILWKIDEVENAYQDQYGIPHHGYVIKETIPVSVTTMHQETEWSEDEFSDIPVEVLITVSQDGKHYIRRTELRGRRGPYWYCQEDFEESQKLKKPLQPEVTFGDYVLIPLSEFPHIQVQTLLSSSTQIVDSKDYYTMPWDGLPVIKEDGTLAERPENPWRINRN